MSITWALRVPLILACALTLCPVREARAGRDPSDSTYVSRHGDVVSFVGGESVVLQGQTGHLESLLAAAFAGRGVTYRNLGWEGDTVFEQPRDLNFPGLAEQLKRVKATVVFAQFGRAESLGGRAKLPAFVQSYGRLCDVLAADGRRVVLLTPAPFERPRDARLPDLSARNADLAAYAAATVELAEKRGLPCADVFTSMGGSRATEALTHDGQRPTTRGLAVEAHAIVAGLGIEPACDVGETEAWPAPRVEAVRQAVVEKNRLWFDYSRPMNWAFLGGDRTFTASSRDPDDPKVRIFPRELEKFVPLIERADAKVEELAKAARGEK